MPAAPLVEPPAWRSAIAFWISALRSPRRRRQRDAARAGVDDDRDAIGRGRACRRASASRSSRAAACRAASSSPTRRAGTRDCAAACCSLVSRRACRPMSASRWRGSTGTAATSVVTENGASSCGVRVGEAEVVDQLLDAHRVGRRQRALVEEPADVRVRRGVDVDREGRERIVSRRGGSCSRRSDRRPRC